jgi:hypothetical protein
MAEDDNVIITRRKYPDPPPPIAREKPPPVIPYKPEFLSRQAEEYLRKAGYSRSFINSVGIFLTDAANTNRMTTHFYTQKPKVSEDLPRSLRGMTDDDGTGREVMPSLMAYAITSRYHADLFKAFMSKEGQRFMHREYNWLERNETTKEWEIVPPKPSEIVPRRADKG